jgi:hypothetical protein
MTRKQDLQYLTSTGVKVDYLADCPDEALAGFVKGIRTLLESRAEMMN